MHKKFWFVCLNNPSFAVGDKVLPIEEECKKFDDNNNYKVTDNIDLRDFLIRKYEINDNSISICLPIYNEAKSIEKVINEWVNCMDQLKVDYEIICSEDGSTDGTDQIIKNICIKNNKIINNHSKEKRGYTGAVLSGIEKSTKDFIFALTQMDNVTRLILKNFGI